MKVSFLSVLVASSLTQMFAAETGPEAPKLVGVVALPQMTCAILKLEDDRGRPTQAVFREGDSMSESGLELTRIAAEQGTVQACQHRTNRFELRLSKGPQPVKGMVLEGVRLDSTLWRLYGALVNRTVLQAPNLPNSQVSLKALTNETSQVVRALELALQGLGISMLQDGEKFVRVFPTREAAKYGLGGSGGQVTTTEVSKPGEAAKSTGSDAEPIPAGMIDFRGVPPDVVATILADLIGRKLDRERRYSGHGSIFLLTQTALSKTEAIYAMETVMGWNGVKMVPVGQDMVQAVANSE